MFNSWNWLRLRGLSGEMYIKRYYEKYQVEFSKEINTILKFDEDIVNSFCNDEWEFALPGCKRYLASGYYKYMFGRYFYALSFIHGKSVLDTGSGLGWGSYLISRYAKDITGIDINNNAIDFSIKNWTMTNMSFQKHSALDLAGLKKKYDVLLGFELIEHLNECEGLLYLNECFNVLNPKGTLILSSLFASNQAEADAAKKNNSFHLHIFTKDKFIAAAKKAGFGKISLVGNILAKAVK
jgi:2-polyprenyl-3-methyl-5-hydroxy-6-metoxy-1,4-benzoquinol methylase